MNITTNYLSNIGLFKRYIQRDDKGDILKNNIFGLSGTLGS